MRIPSIRRPVAVALLSIAGACTSLIPQDALADYYARGAEGWFWYVDPPVPKEEEIKEEEPKPEEPSVIVMKAPAAESAQVSPAGPSALSAAWFRENLQVYMDKAIDDPSPENVEAYFLLQRVMMDKAQDFSDMSRRVVAGDPILDESNRRSMDPSSARLQETLSAQRREEALRSILNQAGLAFFFSEDCDLCANQGQYLNFLAERTGIEIMPISLDGKPLSNGLFAETMVTDQGQAEALGLKPGAPALFLLAPPDKWIALSYSAITQEDVITRVLMGAVEAGLISEDELNRTKPINITPSLAKSLPEDGSLPEDPQELIRFLRNLEKH